MDRPRDWLACVNEARTQAELEAVQLCIARGRPFGSPVWTTRTAARGHRIVTPPARTAEEAGGEGGQEDGKVECPLCIPPFVSLCIHAGVNEWGWGEGESGVGYCDDLRFLGQ